MVLGKLPTNVKKQIYGYVIKNGQDMESFKHFAALVLGNNLFSMLYFCTYSALNNLNHIFPANEIHSEN